MKRLENYIAGEWVQANSSEYLEVTNPATAEVLAEVPLSLSSDLDLAANAAAITLEVDEAALSRALFCLVRVCHRRFGLE